MIRYWNLFDWLCLIAGIILLSIGIWKIQLNEAFYDRAQSVEGRVTMVDERQQGIVVQYEVDDHSYVYFGDPGPYHKGDNVTLYYAPEAPGHATIVNRAEFRQHCVTMFVLALPILCLGLFSLRYYRRDLWLKERGKCIWAKVTHIYKDKRYSMGDPGWPAYPWVIKAQWQDPESGITYHFVSNRKLWLDSTRVAHAVVIPVYIMPSNPRKYWIDIALKNFTITSEPLFPINQL